MLRRGRRTLAAGVLATGLALGGASLAPADPPATFSVAPDRPPFRGEAVTLTASASCAAPVTCTWSGDGGLAGEGRELVHSFGSLGSHRVTLTVDDPTEGSGEPETSSQDIEVVNRPPVVRLSTGSSPAAIGEQITFSSTATDPDAEDALTYAWEVDGVPAQGDGPTLVRAFATPGTHTVRVRVADGQVTVTASAAVEVVNGRPVGAISATPASPLTNEGVTLSAVGEDPEGGVLDYAWDLDGDDQFDDASGATVGPLFFPAPGLRAMRVRVTDPAGAEIVATLDLEVRNRPPTADFSWTPAAVERNRPVTFTSQAADPEGTELEQAWDLDGDGSYDDAFGGSVTHTFRSGGTHEVGLRVRDAHGAVTIARLPVVAGNRAPVAAFTVSPERPVAGQTLELVSLSSDPDGTIAALAWDLDGDGAFDDATGPRAERPVTAAGQLTVGLRVTDDEGGVDVTQRILDVTTPGAAPRPAPAVRPRKLLDPFPTVRVAGRLTGRGAVFRLVTVRAPRGSRVAWSCAPRRCPAGRRAATGAAMRMAALERSFAAGVVLEFRVSRPGWIGKYTRIQVRRGRAPGRRDLCLRSAAGRPTACPS